MVRLPSMGKCAAWLNRGHTMAVAANRKLTAAHHIVSSRWIKRIIKPLHMAVKIVAAL